MGLLLVLPFFFLLWGCGASPSTPLRATSPVSEFLPTPSEVPNPERGFASDSYYPDEPALDASAKVREARERGFEVRLIRRTYYLHAFAGQDRLPQSFLATLEGDLESAKRAGVKLVLRFAYRPEENRPGGPTYCDPPEARILAHLRQMGPVLRAHLGAIAYLEAGLIGPWGEWHSASPEEALMDPLPGYQEGSQPPCGQGNYDRKLPNQKTLELVRALLEEVPGKLVALRYPMAKAKLLELEAGGPTGTYPDASFFTPLTPSEAHGGSLKARLGAHNDCFLASENDYGTYYYDPGQKQEREKAYWSADALYTVMGGETCTSSPYVPPGEDPGRYVYESFRRFRFSVLNLNYHPGFLAWLRATPFGEGSLLEALKRDLGYRLHLRRAEVDRVRLSLGEPLSLTLDLENLGFGSLYNPKALRLVFVRNKDGFAVIRPLEERFFGPPAGERKAYACRAQAPEAPGTYALFLELADPENPGDPRYHVRLATQTEFKEGRNALNLSVEVR
ncbi:DUF4832 domain-containing protein [Thermus sp.]|uniref:DUF4832 domain-containing protein n=1 Tax=Thermus sp. TaxID=275 RepID=UPI003D0ACD3C